MSTSTLRWFKSSYSDSGGADCVEVAYDWHKSSHSDSGGGNCVEVASCPHAVHVRDSKSLGPTFAVAPTAWADFAGWAAHA
ncbi:DUF397 domain-containing protein [Streptomyces sp. NBC_01565]|uniref:DUF397 domain-containing protein n=1 Tax=Streptomyces sp. NBC_01565 TaxID=2975881 RepID=UPI002256C127|nr:DUF397 domain-containing protein [Streptomyces sp. NBC_01565]MCX4542316.1 DUF397 domain-containing protein [Streptomyces sp. NBC_01565]